jgi:DNA-binding ferritin-like protein (Dps family)
MNHFQAIIAVVVSLVIPVISMAEQTDVTMEVIESLDDINTHHRISLPSRAVVQDVLDMAVEKVVVNQQEREVQAEKFNAQRDQIDALIADAEDSGIAKQRESLKNHIKNASDHLPPAIETGDTVGFQDSMKELRDDLADNILPLADELKEIPEEFPAAVSSKSQ